MSASVDGLVSLIGFRIPLGDREMARSIDPSICDRWHERLVRFESSGLTVAAFCRAEGVSQAGFYQWRKKLGSRSDSNDCRNESAQTSPTFVPVVPTSVASACVVVVFANDVRVEVPAGDFDLVGHVVQVAASTGRAGDLT